MGIGHCRIWVPTETDWAWFDFTYSMRSVAHAIMSSVHYGFG